MPPAGIEPAHAVWEASGQRISQLAQLAEELNRLGVVLCSATEPFDTSAAAGRMMLQMLGVFAEFEHATIVDRVTAGIERRAKKASGRPDGCRSATGATSKRK